jgi:hypothetical protein
LLFIGHCRVDPAVARTAGDEGTPDRLPRRDLARGVRAGDRGPFKGLVGYEEGKNIAIYHQFESDIQRAGAFCSGLDMGKSPAPVVSSRAVRERQRAEA